MSYNHALLRSTDYVDVTHTSSPRPASGLARKQRTPTMKMAKTGKTVSKLLWNCFENFENVVSLFHFNCANSFRLPRDLIASETKNRVIILPFWVLIVNSIFISLVKFLCRILLYCRILLLLYCEIKIFEFFRQQMSRGFLRRSMRSI